MRPIIAIAASFLLCSATAHAEIYSYQDASGATHFTDDLSKIPQKKRKQATVRPGGTTSRDWQYFNTEYSTNYYYDPSSISYLTRDRYTVLVKEEYQREFYEKSVEIDCNRMMYRYGGSSEVNNSIDEEETFYRYDDYTPMNKTMRALSRFVCRK